MQFPPELLNQIGVVLEFIVAGVVALTVAFWIAMVVWVFRDIRLRTRDFFAWILAALLALVMGPIGVILYLFLRPKETIAEVYDRQLEEEALLRDISLRRACSQCQAVTEPDWLVCPHCKAELRRLCDGCGKPMDLNWVICPYCATAPARAPQVVQSYAPPAAPTTVPAAQPVNAVTPDPARATVATGDGWGTQG
jgi:RNA polymerase subunit RPABC4/transcription elongation factor Spt4